MVMRARASAAAILLCCVVPVLLANAKTDLISLQHDWAVAHYHLSDDEQKRSFESLLKRIDELTSADPGSAELWIWSGIIKSSCASTKEGLGALSLVKDARKALEKAISIDDLALDGAAYASLGALYHRAPGWPIGFGSDEKANQYLTKALAINPHGIDPNYFYGQYLYDEGEYGEALKHLMTAQQAASRPDRELADISRQQEIADLLQKVEKKLKP